MTHDDTLLALVCNAVDAELEVARMHAVISCISEYVTHQRRAHETTSRGGQHVGVGPRVPMSVILDLEEMLSGVVE